MTLVPVDWDGESYCCTNGCHEPATTHFTYGVALDDDPSDPLVEYAEMRCLLHADTPLDA